MTPEDSTEKHIVKVDKLAYPLSYPELERAHVDEEPPKEVTGNPADNLTKHLGEEAET